MAKIDAYLIKIHECGASDLHLVAGAPPKLRIRGELDPMPDEPLLTQENLTELLLEVLDSKQKKNFLDHQDLDFAYSLKGLARFRCNYFAQKRGYGAVFRIIPEKIKTLEDLNLPASVQKLVHFKKGLILVTGPTGSGKSTTLAAVIDKINSTQSRHILTIEDPIEFVHGNKKALIRQREVGADTRSFANALRAALREDIDVVLVGEMRDLETIALAITLAETGALVFGTLHTSSAAKTIDRIIDVFPVEQQEQIRAMLADSLQAIVAQQLVPTKDGKSRVAVLETLFSSPAIANVIREAKTQQIMSLIQAGGAEGMQTLDAAMMDLIQKELIGAEEAYMRAVDKKMFESLLLEALMEAASNGQLGRISAMIKEGVSIDARDVNSGTPLILAAAGGHAEVARLLIENNADINAADSSGMTALMRAVQKERIEIVQILIAAGVDVQIKNNGGHSALMIAGGAGDATCTQALIAAGSDLNAKDNLGSTVLIRSAIAGHQKVVELLVKAKAQLDLQDKSDRTALLYAAEKGFTAIAAALLQAGANPNASAKGGVTALMCVARQDAGIVQLLLQHGADVNAQTEEGNTALLFASKKGNAESVRALIHAGADVNARSKEGLTPLLCAARTSTETVRVLLEAGADPQIKAPNGYTLLRWAEESNQSEIVALLKEGGKSEPVEAARL